MDINKLSEILKQTNTFFKSKAASAVNTSLTLRNWLFGFYIVEYEQKGEDRAKYGDKFLKDLVKELSGEMNEISLTYLKNVRKFYFAYPQIGQTLSDLLGNSSSLKHNSKILIEKGQTLSDLLLPIYYKSQKQAFQENNTEQKIFTPPDKLVQKVPYSHFVELIKITDPLKRTFYEIETINGTWSVRELKRQIATLYYERSGLSRDKEKLHALVNQKTEKLQVSDILKNPFAFDFLGFRNREIIEETDLELTVII